MGPLAPRRDVGNSKETYGTVSPKQLGGVVKEKSQRKDWCIREGDRVVIVASKHRDRGKIGKVKSVREDAEECTVEGLNMVCLVFRIRCNAKSRPISQSVNENQCHLHT